MKGLWLFLPALAGFVNAEYKERNFMTSCSQIQLDPARGFLNAFCPSLYTKQPNHVTHVDLNGCLAWGSSDQAGVMDNALYPANKGNFSHSCSSCHIIQKGESIRQAGYILCNCATKGSDVELEYMYDLKKIVELDDSGCLQCENAPSVCRQIKRRKSPELLEGEQVSPSAVPGLIERRLRSFGPYAKLNITECEGSVLDMQERHPNAIPKTYRASMMHPCEQDKGPGLCCYLTPGGFGYGKLGFHFIEDTRYAYRIEYGRDLHGTFSVLKSVLRFCKFPEDPTKCIGGDSDQDNVGPTVSEPGFPEPTSTRPTSAPTLDTRGIRTSTRSRSVTGVPDIYFPTPTLSSGPLPSPGLTTIMPVPRGHDLEIDLGHLDAPGLIDIMLGATNIEKVRDAHLDLRVTTNCFTYKDGKVNCKEVVVQFTGRKIGGNFTHSFFASGTTPLSFVKTVTMQEAEKKSKQTSKSTSYDSTETITKTSTALRSSTTISTLPPTTKTTTVSTHKSRNGTALPTGLSKRLETLLPPVSTPATPLPQLHDTAQAVLGPRAATSTEELQRPVYRTEGLKSTTTSESKPTKSKSKKPKEDRTTKTKTKKITKTELKPTTKTVTDTKNTFTMTQTQTIPGNVTETFPPGLKARSQPLTTVNEELILNSVGSTAPTSEDFGSTVVTTVGGRATGPSVIVTYITEGEPLSEDTNNRAPSEFTQENCGLMGCPWVTNYPGGGGH